MTTGSSPPGRDGRSPIIRRRTASFQLACADCGSVRWARSAARSSLSHSVGFLEIAALRPSPSQSRPLLRLVWFWKASGDPKSGERSDSVAPRARSVGREPATRAATTSKGHSGTRTPTDLIPPSRKRGGRSFGAALSEVAIAPTALAGLATGQAMSRSPSGARRFRGWRQRFGARVMPYVGSGRWWLNRLAPLRCLKCAIYSATEKRKGPLAPFTADRSAPRGSLGSVAGDPQLLGGKRLTLAPRPPGLPPRPVRPTRGAWPGARLQAARCAPRASEGAASRSSSGPFEVVARTERTPPRAFYQGKP
jgi:hypothetical protein